MNIERDIDLLHERVMKALEIPKDIAEKIRKGASVTSSGICYKNLVDVGIKHDAEFQYMRKETPEEYVKRQAKLRLIYKVRIK